MVRILYLFVMKIQIMQGGNSYNRERSSVDCTAEQYYVHSTVHTSASADLSCAVVLSLLTVTRTEDVQISLTLTCSLCIGHKRPLIYLSYG